MIRRQPIGYVVEIDGSNLLVNLRENARGHIAGHPDGVSTVGQPGDLVGVQGGPDIIVLRILSIAFAEPKSILTDASVTGRIAEPLRQLRGCVIGFLRRDRANLTFTAQDWHLPVLGAAVFPLSDEEMLATIGDQGPANERVQLGSDARNPLVAVQANVNDLLTRHFAILGATGQGKTHFLAAILQRLVKAPHARIVVFDVNGEYAPAFSIPGVRLKWTRLGPASADEQRAGLESLKIPYYALGRHGLSRLLLPSEKTQMPSLRFAVEHMRFIEADAGGARVAGHSDNVFFDDCRQGDAEIAYRQMELIRTKQARLADRWPHMRGLACLAADWYSIVSETRGGNTTYRRNAFSYGHIHSLVNRIRGLIEDANFCSVVDVNGGEPLGGSLSMKRESLELTERIFGPVAHGPNDWHVHVIDLSRLAQDLMPFVLGSLLELYAAVLFRRGPGATHPTLLALEEAHHYLRQLPGDAEIGQHALAYERLAKEGRKFGVSMMISTQRPSEVSPTVLAQCGTWAVFRLSNDSDQRAVSAAAESVASNVARQISGLARGEAVIFGAAMPIATRVNVVPANPVPKSSDPLFVTKWGYGAKGPAGTVDRRFEGAVEAISE
ncbi:ATP-binding protein [Methylocystis sp. B8]|uniref:ATP-binding protein n=1 Tax=Methylocystis sp. B8 TaxID=544938 RepID=UPI0010FD2220|nr:ATP-binding protein [Methylocystis sp. B8]TLG78146.1 ATP-binding protein [Methylocystis sp. B8]